MSASTVAAVTANPTSPSVGWVSDLKQTTRRRAVVVTEKNPNVEMTTAVADHEMIPNGKDLNHSIRGEAVIDKSKDFQGKKGLVSSTVSPRRRKPIPKPEKSKWQTAISVLTKNLVFLVLLIWSGQMLWNWFAKSEGTAGVVLSGALEFERRISELEAFLMKTTKLMQLQVEVVDEKIAKEIGGVRREIGEKVQELGALFQNELKKLEGKTDALDESLGKLTNLGFLTKEDLSRFLEDLSKSEGFKGNGEDLSLDQIRAVAREIVIKEIERHAADGLGMVDYASASGGAKVVRHSEPYFSAKVGNWITGGVKSRNGVHDNAQKMLEPSFGEPGRCFPLKGSTGFVDIRLRTGITPVGFTLEHVAQSVAYDRSSAPKDFRISGWFQGPESTDEAKVFPMGEYTYDLERSSAQTFSTEAVSGVVDTIRFNFTSNHGSTSHTCIYRLRVHGFEPDSGAPLALES